MLLLKVYDAYRDLEAVFEKLTGKNIPFGFDEGIMGGLSNVERLIQEISPLGSIEMTVEEDLWETTLFLLMENKDMDLEERAKRILSGDV